MKRYVLGVHFGLVALMLTVACGDSPHARAEAVMESAVERLTVLHARVDGIISSVEERALPRGCAPIVAPLNIMLSFDQPSDVQSRMRDVQAEYRAAGNECVVTLRTLNRELGAARRIRDRLTPEALAERVTSLRARLATVPPDGLARVLDAAGTDGDAWVALNQVNLSGGSGSVLAPGDLDLRLGEFDEYADRAFDEVARLMALAQEKRVEYFELAGEPVPEP